ncbi:hypothetical protein PVK06_042835 [Gossypium arboreum]|uniref:Uncharacterized protein n=1 Tax=Gossypium arboreum TaxID=29729 RepID=A0ABR0MM86_GOSAR|nr:hypothetical protein PVK06_042835 [Gossypium arboreum]
MGRCIDWAALEQIQMADAVRALLTTDPWGLFFEIVEPMYLELTLELCSTFYLQTAMVEFDDLEMVQFRLSGLVRQLSVPEFGIVLGLYTEEFMDENELDTLNRHIHYSLSKCWSSLVPDSATYDPNRSKTSALTPSLRYLHAILVDTLTGQRENTGVVNTHDAYFLWSMVNRHVFDLVYFIALAIRHQTERYRRGVISIGPYGISSMLHMKMIERRCGTDPLQYRLVQSAEEEDPEDITDDVPPRHEDPPSQPPSIHRPVHTAASLSDISERLTRFEQ